MSFLGSERTADGRAQAEKQRGRCCGPRSRQSRAPGILPNMTVGASRWPRGSDGTPETARTHTTNAASPGVARAPATNGPVRRPRRFRPLAMMPRDTNEDHRVSTPLEPLFDLCFVVAVSQAGRQLDAALNASDPAWAERAGDGGVRPGIPGTSASGTASSPSSCSGSASRRPPSPSMTPVPVMTDCRRRSSPWRPAPCCSCAPSGGGTSSIPLRRGCACRGATPFFGLWALPRVRFDRRPGRRAPGGGGQHAQRCGFGERDHGGPDDRGIGGGVSRGHGRLAGAASTGCRLGGSGWSAPVRWPCSRWAPWPAVSASPWPQC